MTVARIYALIWIFILGVTAVMYLSGLFNPITLAVFGFVETPLFGEFGFHPFKEFCDVQAVAKTRFGADLRTVLTGRTELPGSARTT